MLLLLLKASVLLALMLVAARLQRGSAAARHALWSWTFVALLALPLLTMALPALDVPLPASWATEHAEVIATERTEHAEVMATERTAHTEVMATERTEHTEAIATERTEHTDEPKGYSVSSVPSVADNTSASSVAGDGRFMNRPFTPETQRISTLALSIWFAGSLAALAALLLSLWRVRRLARRAEPLDDGSWREATRSLAATLGLRNAPRVLVNGAVRTSMAGGVWRPLIFLPPGAHAWSTERRHVVLAHELSHLAVRDPLRHIAARLAIACYWFHPLAWLAARQASLAREQACDEAVIALGVRPSDYARVLLELADGLASPPRAAAALPMVERSLLERRLMAILDDGDKPPRRRTPLMWLGIATAITLTVAAARPAAQLTIDVPVTQAAAVAGAGAHVDMAGSLPSPAAVSAAPASATPQTTSPSCWSDRTRGDSFSGYTNTNSASTVIERIGTRGGDRVIQKTFDGVRVCMVGEGAAALEESTPPSQWAAPVVLIEALRPGRTELLETVRRAGGTPQVTWRVDGAERPFDAAAQEWRAAMLAVLDSTWELAMLRGKISTLYGEISTLRGEESSLRGEISTLWGEVSTMRGQQSTIRGEESTLRGEISTIQGHVSSLRGEISSERGSISSLTAGRYDLSADDRRRLDARIRDHEAAIARLEKEIDDYDAPEKIAAVQRKIKELDANGKIAAIEGDIRKFDVEAKVAEIEKRIRALDVDAKTDAIDREIRGLDSRTRAGQLEDRLADELKRLQKTLAAIRRN